MHKTWFDSMRYHNIPEEDWNPFYFWYCENYPQGDRAISAAYEEWKERQQEVT
jgi:hypothetical protein